MGVYLDRMEMEMENDIFHNGSCVASKQAVLRTYRNNPSSKHREIGQSDDITGFQLMHPFSRRIPEPESSLLGIAVARKKTFVVH